MDFNHVLGPFKPSHGGSISSKPTASDVPATWESSTGQRNTRLIIKPSQRWLLRTLTGTVGRLLRLKIFEVRFLIARSAASLMSSEMPSCSPLPLPGSEICPPQSISGGRLATLLESPDPRRRENQTGLNPAWHESRDVDRALHSHVRLHVLRHRG